MNPRVLSGEMNGRTHDNSLQVVPLNSPDEIMIICRETFPLPVRLALCLARAYLIISSPESCAPSAEVAGRSMTRWAHNWLVCVSNVRVQEVITHSKCVMKVCVTTSCAQRYYRTSKINRHRQRKAAPRHTHGSPLRHPETAPSTDRPHPSEEERVGAKLRARRTCATLAHLDKNAAGGLNGGANTFSWQ